MFDPGPALCWLVSSSVSFLRHQDILVASMTALFKSLFNLEKD